MVVHQWFLYIELSQMTKSKLKDNLCEQLQRNDLKPVVDSFIKKLELPGSDLEENYQNFAEYLINEQRTDEERLETIIHFLQTVDQYSRSQVSIELFYDLFAFLLQTLVHECEADDDGIRRLSVNYKSTIKLIYAKEKGVALIPDYKEENLEFNNGKRNARLENIGDFEPTSGKLTVEAVCEEMAEKILLTMQDQHRSPQGPLHTLRGKIVLAKVDPEKSPLHGIYMDEEALSKHSFNNPEVVKHFIEMTKGRLPIYIYRVKNSSNNKQSLYVDEEDLRGIFSGDYEIMKIDNVNKYVSEEKSSENLENNPNHTDNSIHFHVGGDVTGSITLEQKNNIQQLQQQMKHLMRNTQNASDLSEQQKIEIMNTINVIEQEIQKEHGLDVEKLEGAKEKLRGFLDIVSITGAIASIIGLMG